MMMKMMTEEEEEEEPSHQRDSERLVYVWLFTGTQNVFFFFWSAK